MKDAPAFFFGSPFALLAQITGQTPAAWAEKDSARSVVENSNPRHAPTTRAPTRKQAEQQRQGAANSKGNMDSSILG